MLEVGFGSCQPVVQKRIQKGVLFKCLAKTNTLCCS